MNEDLVYIDEFGIDDNEFYKYGWSEKGKKILMYSYNIVNYLLIKSL